MNARTESPFNILSSATLSNCALAIDEASSQKCKRMNINMHVSRAIKLKTFDTAQ